MQLEPADFRGGPKYVQGKWKARKGAVEQIVSVFRAGSLPVDGPTERHVFRRTPYIENGRRVYEWVRKEPGESIRSVLRGKR